VLGVSKDSVEKHRKFKTKYELPFTLLSDPDGEICEKYGVLKQKSMFGKKYTGIERSTFVIDADGTVLEIYRKVKIDGHVQAVLECLG
jgi:peroxiredoxin Q/BCP